MALDFQIKDIMHRIAVKFTHAFLPEAKKPYYLKTVHQPELDIHGIASKAAVYNITTAPKVIEEGMTAGMELIHYLVADGFKIKTPVFNLKMRVPGEYNGSETHLPEGVVPTARLQLSAEFRKYLADRVTVEFDGIEESEGLIAEVTDEATGLVDEVLTMGNILTIHGTGLKIEADESNQGDAGIYFYNRQTAKWIKADIIAVNEPRTLKVLVPSTLTENYYYHIEVRTWSSPKIHGHILKDMRTMRSEFTLKARTA